MEIFFSGSIRGGRSEIDQYQVFVELLNEYGSVLTEHVADPALDSAEDGLSDPEIHDRDLAWLKESDLVVAEVTTPSLGVGYEIGRARSFDTPVIALYHQQATHELSAMVRGNDNIRVLTYDRPADITSALRSLVASHQE